MNSPVRRPIIGIALSFVAGTWAGLNLETPVFHLILATCISLSIAAGWVWSRRRESGRPSSLWPGALLLCCPVFLLAWLNAAVNLTSDAARPHISSLTGAARTKLQISGTVTDSPIPLKRTNGSAWRFPLDVSEARTGKAAGWQPVAGNVFVTWYGGSTTHPPEYGQQWEFEGYASSPKAQTYYHPARARPVVFLSTSQKSSTLKAQDGGNWFVKKCLEQRAFASALLAKGIEDHPAQIAILNSLILGFRSQVSREAYQDFARTGTLHIFAISGSHVVVLAAIIIFVLSTFKIRRTYWILILGPLLTYYTVMTGLQASAIRACIMAIIFWLAPLLKRKPDLYASLALAAVLILAFDPDNLYNVGCILSFVAVLGLVMLYPVTYHPFTLYFQADPLKLEPESRTVQFLRRSWKEVGLLISTSTAAWLTTVPLTAYYFGLFSPIALIGNLVAIPLSSLIIVTGCLSIFCGACSEMLASIFNHANLVFVSLLTGFMRFLASIPYGWMETEPPSGWYILAFYAMLALTVYRFRSKTRKSPTDESQNHEPSC